MHEWFQARHGALVDQIRDTGTLPEGDELADAMAEFKETLRPALADDAAEATVAPLPPRARRREPRSSDDRWLAARSGSCGDGSRASSRRRRSRARRS